MIHIIYSRQDNELANSASYDLVNAVPGLQIAKVMISEENSLLRLLLTLKNNILLLSENFLKEIYVLNESERVWEEIGKRNDILLVKSNLEIEKVSDIIHYINYWQDEYLDLRRKKREGRVTKSEEEYEKVLRNMRAVSGNIGEFLRRLRTYEIFDLKGDYQDLIGNIKKLLEYPDYQVPNINNLATDLVLELHPDTGKESAFQELELFRNSVLNILEINEEVDDEEILLKLQVIIDENRMSRKKKRDVGNVVAEDWGAVFKLLNIKKIESLNSKSINEIFEKVREKDYKIIEMSQEVEKLKNIIKEESAVKKVLEEKLGFSSSVNVHKVFEELDRLLEEIRKQRNLQEMIEIWIDDITRGHTGVVIKRVQDYCKENKLNDLLKDVIQVSVRWNSLKRLYDQGVVKDDDYYLQVNRINSSFIQLIFDLEK